MEKPEIIIQSSNELPTEEHLEIIEKVIKKIELENLNCILPLKDLIIRTLFGKSKKTNDLKINIRHNQEYTFSSYLTSSISQDEEEQLSKSNHRFLRGITTFVSSLTDTPLIEYFVDGIEYGIIGIKYTHGIFLDDYNNKSAFKSSVLLIKKKDFDEYRIYPIIFSTRDKDPLREIESIIENKLRTEKETNLFFYRGKDTKSKLFKMGIRQYYTGLLKAFKK